MEEWSLLELNRQVHRALSDSFPEEVWVHAELSEVHGNPNGHCYVEFVEKNERNGQLVAKARGYIWASTYRNLRPYFERETGQTLVAGLKVLVKVTVEFHELYGYALNVKGIDPSYTIGDRERRRREILQQLEAEGVLTLNKELPFPLLPQRVAVISSPTAAGYGDFCDQLLKNPYGFVFYPKLFEAVMQGEWVESSIIQALDRIFAEEERWDVVVIIRGGGATSDLTGFDTYPLAAACAQFPIPIVTGIGHERDDTVLDMISHTRVKTPTAAAELLIARVLESATRLHQLQERTQAAVTYRLTNERHRLEKLADKVPSLFTVYKLNAEHRLACFEQRWRQASERRLTEEEHRWVRLNERLLQAAQRRVVNEQHRLELLQKEVEHASPERLLKRGYSITLKGNKAVTDASQLREGDVLETRFAQGSVRSVVTPEQNRNAK